MMKRLFRRKKEVEKDIENWTIDDAITFLGDHHPSLLKYKPTFRSHKIDGPEFVNNDKLLHFDYLRDELGITAFGHRVKIKQAIESARKSQFYVFKRKSSKLLASFEEEEGSIYTTDLRYWTQLMTQKWTEQVATDPKDVKSKFQEHFIDGSCLAELPDDESELDDFLRDELDIFDPKLGCQIKRLKENKVYQKSNRSSKAGTGTQPYDKQPEFRVIKYKVSKNKRLRDRFEDDEQLLPLYKPELMMDQYLRMDVENTEGMTTALDAHSEENKKKNDRRRLTSAKFTSRSDTLTSRPTSEGSALRGVNANGSHANARNQRKVLKVKLIISEIAAEGTTQRKVRDWLAPVLHHANLQPQFGMFHTAICVGPWYIEWNTSELCRPRVPDSKAALITADIDGITVDDDCDTVRRKLAEEICRWNTTKAYSERSKNKESVGNCQDFVEAIMKKLNVKPDWKDTALGEYFESMRRKGTCEMEFKVTKEFQKRMQIPAERFNMDKKRRIVFDNHQELDEFVIHCIKKEPTFGQNIYVYESRLLKGFDRAFWLRHFREPESSRYKPVEKMWGFSVVEEEEDDDEEKFCPFGNPSETSFVA